MKKTLVWYFKVGMVFVKRTPFYTFFSVLFTIASQISILISFFLPLKIIILLGSDGVPRYFPQFLVDIDRDFLVLALSIVSVMAYVCHIGFEKIIAGVVGRGAASILLKNEKINIFENQQLVAERSYERYSKCLSGLFFIFLVLFFYSIFYPLLLLGVIAVFLLFLLSFLLSKRLGFDKVGQEFFLKNSKAVSGLGFLLSFSIIIVDFIFYSPPGVIYVMVSMVLSRQLFNKFGSVVADMAALYSQRSKVNVLFFSRHVFRSEPGVKEASVWKVLERGDWKKELGDAVELSLDDKVDFESTDWVQNVTPGIVGVIISGEINRYYFKIFDKKRTSWAMHEAALLVQEESSSLPALQLFKSFTISGLSCHLFVVNGCSPLKQGEYNFAVYDVAKSLMKFPLNSEIVNSYMRSRPVLWQRLDEAMFARLNSVGELISNKQYSESVKNFYQVKNRVISCLKMNPLVVVNPDVKYGHVWKKNNEPNDMGVMASNWARWCLEPMGAAWPISKASLVELEGGFDDFVKGKKDEVDISYNNVKLAAFVYEFERRYERQYYEQAIDLIPAIISVVYECEL